MVLVLRRHNVPLRVAIVELGEERHVLEMINPLLWKHKGQA